MTLKNLKFDTIRKDSVNVINTESDSYIETYPEFIQYFRNLDRIERHHLIISSHFIYGWMPTIIEIDLKNTNEVLRLLNEVKSGKLLNVEELLVLKKCINNSLVGLSKLLHFINPSLYAIWDSRIFRYLTEKKSSYGIDNPNTYLEYLNEIKKVSEHPDYKMLHKLIESNFEYKIEPMRAIEIVMFETDRKRDK
ncbi:MAG: hypothetical protein JNK09_01550 [Prolixibacteraceae bacterium]|nr:hypothetical protein [Prolixibacteraceae bacterium]